MSGWHIRDKLYVDLNDDLLLLSSQYCSQYQRNSRRLAHYYYRSSKLQLPLHIIVTKATNNKTRPLLPLPTLPPPHLNKIDNNDKKF